MRKIDNQFSDDFRESPSRLFILTFVFLFKLMLPFQSNYFWEVLNHMEKLLKFVYFESRDER